MDKCKDEEGKIPATVEPIPKAIESIAKVRQFGLKKYPIPNSWKKVSIQQYNDALMRHFLAVINNPCSVDEETGLLHIEHLLCNAAFLNQLIQEVKNEKT